METPDPTAGRPCDTRLQWSSWLFHPLAPSAGLIQPPRQAFFFQDGGGPDWS